MGPNRRLDGVRREPEDRELHRVGRGPGMARSWGEVKLG